MSRKKGAFAASGSFSEQEVLRVACQQSPAQWRINAVEKHRFSK